MAGTSSFYRENYKSSNILWFSQYKLPVHVFFSREEAVIKSHKNIPKNAQNSPGELQALFKGFATIVTV